VKSETLGWRDIALVLVATLPFFVNLGQSALWGSEDRWVFISREMLRTGNWLEPILEGQFYGDKPLLSYWAILLVCLPFGRIDESLARLPSALAGAVTVLLTAFMAARLFGRRSAIHAGWILSTAYSFLFWSRSASADLINVAFVTGAVLLYLKARSRFRGWHALAFFAVLALGGHAKGMPAILLPIAIAVGDLALSRPQAFLRRFGWGIAGLVLGIGIYMLPFALSRASHGDWSLLRLMWRENFVRALDAFDHRASPLFYVYTFPAMFIPWSPWLLGALPWSALRFRREQSHRFTLLAFGAIFLAFTASESRRSYYILPLFPFAAILIAAFWDQAALAHDTGKERKGIWTFLLVGPIFAYSAVAVLAAVYALSCPFLPAGLAEPGGSLPYVAPFAAAMGASGVLAAVLAHRRSGSAWDLTCWIALFLSAYIVTGLETLNEGQRVERAFAETVKRRVPAQSFVYYKGCHGRLRYYVGEGTDTKDSGKLHEILAEKDGDVLVICGPEGKKALEEDALVSETEVLRQSSPPIGNVVKAADRYFLFLCRRR